MSFSGLQPQIWFSMFVIIAAAGIALLTMLLKKRDDKMRELVVELRMRREEEQRRLSYERLNGSAKRRSESHKRDTTEKPAAPASPQNGTDNHDSRGSEVRDRNLAIRRAQGPDIEFTAKSSRRRRPQTPPEAPARRESTNPKEALSGWLNRRAAARASQTTAPETVEPTAASIPSNGKHGRESQQPIRQAEREPEKAVVQPKAPSVVVDEFLWDSIVSQPAPLKETAKTASNARFEVIQGAASHWLAGLHEQPALDRLLESNRPFTGLAVAIGVHQNDGRAVGREAMMHIQQMVRSMIRGDEFACQTGADEFLLLCPGPQGDEARRRLSGISERLWDFQLRGIGNFSILFNTADAQVSNEPLRQPVAAARAKLQQTRRTRKTVSLDFLASRKLASAAV